MKKENKIKLTMAFNGHMVKCGRCNDNGCPACEKLRIRGYLPEEYEKRQQTNEIFFSN